MISIQDKHVLVLGLGASGMSAADFLTRHGAWVEVFDDAETTQVRAHADRLREWGSVVGLKFRASNKLPDLVVTSPGIAKNHPLLMEMRAQGVPVVGEFELGYQHSRCLNVAVTGTNGKTTTTELIESVLLRNDIKTIAAGNIGVPVTSLVEQTQDLDVLTLEVSSYQLEDTEYFRPAAAVLLNLTPDHLDRYASMEDYIRAKARIFANQQPFDWAIIQKEALKKIEAIGISIPSKIITFSSTDRDADIYLDRGLLISRIDGWSGPLLDMDQCQLRGPHNAENLMAALAVGRVFRVPLGVMADALQSYQSPPHRCEIVANINGVEYINDSKATNVDAVEKALLSAPGTDEKNVWLIAGGKDKGFDFHALGPVLAARVKGAFLIGETQEKIRGAWGLFIPCTLSGSLLEAVSEAAQHATSGDVVLLSPACSSFDQFQDYQHRGEEFRRAVRQLSSKLDMEEATVCQDTNCTLTPELALS